MAWESRGKHRYFYASVREDGRVKKFYLGRGQRAALAEQVRQAEMADQRLAETIEHDIAPLVRLDDELDHRVGELTEAVLLVSGFHRHHGGEWRKQRGNHTIKS